MRCSGLDVKRMQHRPRLRTAISYAMLLRTEGQSLLHTSEGARPELTSSTQQHG